MKKVNTKIIADENLINRIYFIRGQKVMIDRDLAELYGVETKQLKRQVKRNIDRFPVDFMFELRKEEFDFLRRQFGTLRWGEHSKFLPYAFTEQGVVMLSSVLNSKQAIAVNIQIIRVFTKMREIISSNKEILLKLDLLEKKVDTNSEDIEEVFSVLRQLINPEPVPRKRVGYKMKKED
ncbi:MAG TPA: ORF6N domain-containing protein [Bacteroidia bacterium]|nr:ORF6N domain-containing protein [Bacteroidia bacterium]